ncbi:myo-inositol transporter 1 [Verticillium alfalfae VaMs.102]|uniref:Myo-inositol transporter 1 n=1 Tax=Verticillium alfalfae (strain VaMs.102 / ATCC MYA-4576 / FGSC 10136) TaxID=526221 RepID=C9SKR6_VERA1|nr:myo-inositol transporter 1 [Verticillium alfalfae VaMs.102]EEY19284.1 myo-inositol transporter 1 [Verticillium alfalfae VaMs.102]
MPHSSQAPLISDRQDRERDDRRDDDDEELLRRDDYYDDGDADADADADEHTLPPPIKTTGVQASLFIWLLTFAAGISGLLFGCVISATLVSIDNSLSNRELTSFDKSIITSSTALFALIVSPFSSVVADALGRRRVILLADFLFVLGALLQAGAHTVTFMVFGRAVVGAAVGAASFVVPLYIAEIAPATHRGRLVTTNVLFITLGQVVAYIVGWGFSVYGDKNTAWRWMVGLGAVPAAVQMAVVMYMPETPRWLVMVGRSALAKRVVHRVAGGRPSAMRDAEAVVQEIEIEIRSEREVMRREGSPRLEWWGGWQELLTVGRNMRTLDHCLTAAGPAATIGRRRIMLYSLPFMIAGLLLAAYGFSFLDLAPSTSTSTAGDARPPDAGDPGSTPSVPGGGEDEGASTSHGAALMILVSIMIYVAAYAIGLGNVPWMQSELFPLAVRSIGSGVATSTNWAANFVVGLTFLPLMDTLTPPWTFTLYALLCTVGYALVWRIYPETAGLSLEEATGLLDNGWGVRR